MEPAPIVAASGTARKHDAATAADATPRWSAEAPRHTMGGMHTASCVAWKRRVVCLVSLLAGCGSSDAGGAGLQGVPVPAAGSAPRMAPAPPPAQAGAPTPPVAPDATVALDAASGDAVGHDGGRGDAGDPDKRLVDALDFDRFRSNVATLAAFGSRFWSRPGNASAGEWIEAELAAYGYEPQRHSYMYQGRTRDSISATKIGSDRPDQMYIVSAHMDSFNLDDFANAFAPGADDDASGVSLVLEAARVFALPSVRTAVSVRFILWNNEETGLDGSNSYAAGRRGLQGREDPPGSGEFPEPSWLGIVQHDMILFDHGNPPGAEQAVDADIDIEFQRASRLATESEALANALLAGNAAYSAEYPAEVGDRMDFTDSVPFQDLCASVSVRENQRIAEIGTGSNPHWHRATDVVDTYSDADFRLGFNATQMTVGTVAKLAGVTMTP